MVVLKEGVDLCLNIFSFPDPMEVDPDAVDKNVILWTALLEGGSATMWPHRVKD